MAVLTNQRQTDEASFSEKMCYIMQQWTDVYTVNTLTWNDKLHLTSCCKHSTLTVLSVTMIINNLTTDMLSVKIMVSGLSNAC